MDDPMSPSTSSTPDESVATGSPSNWISGHRRGFMVGGAVSAALGFLGILLVGNNASICGSGLGQFAQAVSSQAANTCGVDGAINFLSWVLLVGGLSALALGYFVKSHASA